MRRIKPINLQQEPTAPELEVQLVQLCKNDCLHGTLRSFVWKTILTTLQNSYKMHAVAQKPRSIDTILKRDAITPDAEP